MTDQQIAELKDALRLQVTNRAISNVHTRLGLSGQISAALVALCYPVGIIVAGPIGLWAMILLAAAVAGGSLAAIRQESSAIASGDAGKARQYLSPEELVEFNNAAVQIQDVASKKPLGAAAPTNNQESGNGTNPPKSGNESVDVAPVPCAPIKLDPDCPHFLLLAGSREGKSNALRCLLDDHARVNYVSTKATDQVPSHWEGYVIGGTSEVKGKQLKWLLTHWDAKLAAHAAGDDTAPEWFVFDEAIQIQTYAKRSKVKGLAEAIAGLQVEIATQGAAISAYGVLLAQTKNAGPLGIDLDLLQQNFRMVIPLKSKRRLALSVIEKMGGLRLTTEQREDILSNPNRYLQLWLGEDEDIYHDVLPEFEGELKPLVKCPIEYADTAPQQAQQATEPKPLRVRILDYLKGHGEAKTAREIRGACTRSTDSPRASVDEVRDILAVMISEGQITRWEDGSTERYQATGTV
ncbi:MAG: hypothetical protein WBG32_08545 [Nodosilinea sp.]